MTPNIEVPRITPKVEISQERLKEVFEIKKEIKTNFDKLSKFFEKMVDQAEEEFKKEKVTDVIVTDWQSPYEDFANAFLSDNPDEAKNHLETLEVNIGFDMMYRHYLYKSVSTEEWHKPAIELARQIKNSLEKLKNYSDAELKRVPMYLEIKDFKALPVTWEEIEKQRQQHMDIKLKKQEKLETAQKLQNALFLQEELDLLEQQQAEERAERGEGQPMSELELDINEELRKLKSRILDELDKLYEALERGEEVDVSIEETISAEPVRRVPTEKAKAPLPKIEEWEKAEEGKKIPVSKISEEPTIAPSAYEKNKKQQSRRKAG